MKIKLFVACALLLCSMSSSATIVISDTSSILNPEVLITFDGSNLASNDQVTNQFAGATFSGQSGSPRYQSCGAGWGSQYIDDGSYIGTYGPGCTQNNTADDITITLDYATNIAEFKFIFYDPNNTGLTVNTLLGGALVETFIITHGGITAANPTQQCGTENLGSPWGCGWLNISGSSFDTIEVLEDGSTDYISLDNLAYGSVVVPAPSALALLLMGLAGLSLRSATQYRKNKI